MGAGPLPQVRARRVPDVDVGQHNHSPPAGGAVSSIRSGDERLHYSDGSHKDIPPLGADAKAWKAKLDAHRAEHLQTMGARTRIVRPKRRGEPRR